MSQTIIRTNKPLDEVAFDVWAQMSAEERIRFLQRIYPRTAEVFLMTGELPERISVRVSTDMLFSGSTC